MTVDDFECELREDETVIRNCLRNAFSVGIDKDKREILASYEGARMTFDFMRKVHGILDKYEKISIDILCSLYKKKNPYATTYELDRVDEADTQLKVGQNNDTNEEVNENDNK